MKITNLIPRYCDTNIESRQNLKAIQLEEPLPPSLSTATSNTSTSTSSLSFLNLGASILQGIEIPQNYKCHIVIESPPKTGLILTFRRVKLNKDDIISIRTGSNPTSRSWLSNDTTIPLEDKEIVTVVHDSIPSSIRIKYEPTVGVSPINAGFDLAITVFKEKGEIDCQGNLNCQNGRCITTSIQCDGYNNCGNNMDEKSCPGHISWWIIGLLIIIAIIVVILSIFVWIRMSKV